MGGSCSSFQSIVAKEIGNKSYANTKITISPLAIFKRELLCITLKINQYETSQGHLRDLFKNLACADQSDDIVFQALLQIAILYTRIDMDLEHCGQKHAALKEKMENIVPARITVTQNIYPNVTIDINDVYNKLTNQYMSCIIREQDGDIIFV